ncbi:unnamed protein product [Linum tenue]|uniref:Uncharacterized protein n=1 Tax=Linum tenue TaxID=586396 RepID=A0AAV0J303_9ROSI|nr:unnamed protein product [Linum tenue]
MTLHIDQKGKDLASHFKSGDAPNSSSLQLLLPSVLSFLGLKIDDSPY